MRFPLQSSGPAPLVSCCRPCCRRSVSQSLPRARHPLLALSLPPRTRPWCRHASLPLSTCSLPLGVGHVILERAAALTQHPQAHFINHRTMEVGSGSVSEIATAVDPVQSID
jgi:hypothetical protein